MKVLKKDMIRQGERKGQYDVKLHGRCNDNSGFTLIELIIVMAIIMVTVFFFITGISLIFSLPAKQCSRELKAALEKMRIDTMGKNAAGLRIYRDDKGGIFIEELYFSSDLSGNSTKVYDVVAKDAEKIGDRRVIIKYIKDGGSDLEDFPSSGDGVIVAFKRDTGGIYTYHENYEVGDKTAVYVKEFFISGGRSSYRLKLSALTGYVTLEKAN